MSTEPAGAWLASPLTSALGGKTAKALATSLDLHTVEDLLRYYPRRYVERGEMTQLANLQNGERVTVLVQILEVKVRPMRHRKGTILEAIVTDGTDNMSVTFFNQKWREREFRVGRRGLFAGEVSVYRKTRQLLHPECQLFPDGVTDDIEAEMSFAGAIIPIYPASKSVTSWQVQSSVGVLLDQLPDLPDPIPGEILASRGFLGLSDALRAIHRPETRPESVHAIERLRYEEAFTLQCVLAQRKAETRALPATRRVPEWSPLVEDFDARLPFTLTEGQREVSSAIEADLAQSHPMHRLLQGDVGSGKTVVALRAMLRVVDAGGQAALLAPTEVLAAQHHRSITQLLGPLAQAGQLGGADHATKVALLTGSLRTAQRRKELLDIVSGDAGIVVGTHALIQEHVDFHDLALVVVDEQHRFGVEQRAALTAKSRDGSRPHVLVMTATPIPRTVAMTVFGDVDVSTLSELPAGRAPISTHVVVPHEHPELLQRTWQRVREEVEAGHRVFVVCPRIGEADVPEADDPDLLEDPEGEQTETHGVVPFAAALAENELAGLRLGVLHGRVPADEKDDLMRRFASSDAPDAVDVLVATTVIEVGVDVPLATMIVVMDAERFGISQLHQLRGRVGRGGLPGLAILVSDARSGSPSRQRLAAVASTTDGFELSALDLQMRREGDVLGQVQSGRRSSLRLLEVARHEGVISMARADAHAVLEADPTLASHPALAAAIAVLRQDEQAQFLEKA